LQDVVARRGDEAGLGDIGLFGLALGTTEFRIEAGQFFGALLYPPLKRFVGALEFFRGLHGWGDVRKGGYDPAVRHWIRTHFHDQIAVGKTLQERFAVVHVPREPLAHERVSRLFIGGAPLGVEAQDVVERSADPGELRRQCEDFTELAIPADEVQILVKHRNALPHMVERGLQDLAIVMNSGVGVVEELERCLGRYRALAQQER
jgi:hypothetical protein